MTILRHKPVLLCREVNRRWPRIELRGKGHVGQVCHALASRFSAGVDSIASRQMEILGGQRSPNVRGEPTSNRRSSSGEYRGGARYAHCSRSTNGLIEASRAMGLTEGMATITGRAQVFYLFLKISSDAFHLSRVGNVRLPGGRPIFPDVPALTPEKILIKHGLVPGPCKCSTPRRKLRS